MLKLKAYLDLLKNIFRFIENFFSFYITGFVILSMMLLIAFEILGRKFFSISFPEIVDIVSLGMLIIVFCSLPGIQRDNEHLRVDFLVGKFKGTILFLSKLFEQVVTLATCLFFTHASFEVLKYTIKFNVLSEVARIQKWFFVIFIPISLTLMCIRIISQIVNHFFLISKANKIYEETNIIQQ